MNIKKVMMVSLVLILFSSLIMAEESDEFDVDPGILPDSPFYFVDQLFERAGDSPQKALELKEEKIAEARAMALKNKPDHARKALEHANEYGIILEREVTPDMEERIQTRTALVKSVLNDISKDVPELKSDISTQLEQEERTKLAAQVSGKIKRLCETLSELDPVKYAETCQAGADAPKWQKDLDKELTKDQKNHAKLFAGKLEECFSNPAECDCKGMKVQSFEDLCLRKSRAFAQCQDGNEEACNSGDEDINFEEYLPDYLLPVIKNMQREEGRSRDDYEDYPFPSFCQEAGVSSWEECEDLRRERDGFGEYQNENRADNYPPPCKEEGAATDEECKKIMQNFQGEGQENFERRGPPRRIQEFGRDCHAVQDLSEKVRCFEDFYDSAKDSFSENFEREYEHEDYAEKKEEYLRRADEERRGPPFDENRGPQFNQRPDNRGPGNAEDYTYALPQGITDEQYQKYQDYPGEIPPEFKEEYERRKEYENSDDYNGHRIDSNDYPDGTFDDSPENIAGRVIEVPHEYRDDYEKYPQPYGDNNGELDDRHDGVREEGDLDNGNYDRSYDEYDGNREYDDKYNDYDSGQDYDSSNDGEQDSGSDQGGSDSGSYDNGGSQDSGSYGGGSQSDEGGHE